MPKIQPRRTRRRGFSYLELQISFVLFAIGLSGIMPLVVMQSRQLQQLESRFDDQTTYYLAPSDSSWARKLGAAPSLSTTAPSPPPSPPVTLIDNGQPGYSEQDLGSIDWHTVVEANAYQGEQRRNNGGNIGDSASWQFTGLSAGWYEVLVTFSEDDDQAMNAPFTVYDNLDTLGTVLVDQQEDPSGPIFDGSPWESLGVFLITSDTLSVQLTDNANGDIAADAVRIVSIANDVEILSLDKSLTSEEVTAHTVITVNTP